MPAVPSTIERVFPSVRYRDVERSLIPMEIAVSIANMSTRPDTISIYLSIEDKMVVFPDVYAERSLQSLIALVKGTGTTAFSETYRRQRSPGLHR